MRGEPSNGRKWKECDRRDAGSVGRRRGRDLGTWLVTRSEPQLGPHDGLDLSGLDTGRVAIGDIAPDFSLVSYAGPVTTLSDFRGDKNVVLQFYRGYW